MTLPGQPPARFDVDAQVALPPAVVVASRSLPRGAVLSAASTSNSGATRVASDDQPTFASIDEVRRNGNDPSDRRRNAVLDRDAVRSPLLVRRSEVITVTAVARRHSRDDQRPGHGRRKPWRPDPRRIVARSGDVLRPGERAAPGRSLRRRRENTPRGRRRPWHKPSKGPCDETTLDKIGSLGGDGVAAGGVRVAGVGPVVEFLRRSGSPGDRGPGTDAFRRFVDVSGAHPAARNQAQRRADGHRRLQVPGHQRRRNRPEEEGQLQGHAGRLGAAEALDALSRSAVAGRPEGDAAVGTTSSAARARWKAATRWSSRSPAPSSTSVPTACW